MFRGKKEKIILSFAIFFCFIYAHSIELPSMSYNSASSDLLLSNKINHNFNFSVITQFNNFGSTTLYSIGDHISYNLTDKITFEGNFNLITSSFGFNQFQNSFNNPQLNFDLGLNYNINDNSSFQLRLIKNSLNPNCNTIAF